MTRVKKLAGFLPLAVVLASSEAFAIKVQTGSEDLNVNLNLLLQVRAQGDWDGPGPAAATATEGVAPNGNFNTDFYVKRARLSANGTAYKYFTFNINFDTPNFGARGNYTGSFGSTFIQDLVVGFVPVKDFNIEVGFLLMPLAHSAVSFPGGQSALESPAHAGILYNNQRGLRENGVQIRSLLLDHRLVFRAGAYEGLRTTPNPTNLPAATLPVVNPNGRPLVAGMVRWNLIGDELGYGYNGIYLDGKSRVSIGVGGHYQPKGSSVPDARGAPQGVADYVALAADAFVDYALPGDTEVVAQAAGYRFDYGPGSAKTGYGASGDVGFRYGPIEPQANFYWFNNEAPNHNGSFLKVAGGLNYFFRGHQAKIAAEFAHILNPSATTNLNTGTALHEVVLQGQMAF